MRSHVLDDAFSKLNPDLFFPYADKTILITGATGLVGSLLCKSLLWANEVYKTNIHVIAVARNANKVTQILNGYLSTKLSIAPFDLSSDERLIAYDIDFIVHAASITSSNMMITNPIQVIDTSLNGTRNMLELALTNSARMVYISSMEFYGTLPDGEIADESKLGYLNLSSVRSCYPESKRMCECLCNAFASQNGVQVCSARLAQTFGAGVLETENRAFMQFARCALTNDDIVLKTSGQSEGNYVNSVDAISALLLLLSQGHSGEAYNIADENSHMKIREVASLAINTIGDGKSKIVIDIDESNSAGYAPDVHLKLSSSKIRKLGWNPTTTLCGSFSQLARYAFEQGLI